MAFSMEPAHAEQDMPTTEKRAVLTSERLIPPAGESAPLGYLGMEG